MASVLDQVKTIVLVMMENRSFDHMLGHLTIDNPTLQLNGLKTADMDGYANDFNGTLYRCYQRDNDAELLYDVPHEYDYVNMQLRQNPANGNYSMHGFVEAYAKSIAGKGTPNVECDPMGFFPASFVPITNFLANNFCICDNWFCPIPTSTQPNRTMAFSGDSSIHETRTQLISIPNDIFHWMDKNAVRWRVYHEAFSFFTLYDSLWPYVLGEQFRRYENLYADMIQEPASTAPEVIIVEPCYEDAPHFGTTQPDDNHAPLAIGWGENFLQRTYHAITANPDKWASTMMIVYYDEHGGFFDHQAPPKIPYKTIGGDAYQFDSLGPRIPGLIISPLIKPGDIRSELFDHTSVLQLLAEKFTPTADYSPTVAARKVAGIKSLSAALNNTLPFALPPDPIFNLKATANLGKPFTTPPQSAMGQSFELAGLQMMAQKPAEVASKYPELYQWKDRAAKTIVSPDVVAASPASGSVITKSSKEKTKNPPRRKK